MIRKLSKTNAVVQKRVYDTMQQSSGCNRDQKKSLTRCNRDQKKVWHVMQQWSEKSLTHDAKIWHTIQQRPEEKSLTRNAAVIRGEKKAWRRMQKSYTRCNRDQKKKKGEEKKESYTRCNSDLEREKKSDMQCNSDQTMSSQDVQPDKATTRLVHSVSHMTNFCLWCSHVRVRDVTKT